jgi:hypothetical protein
MEAASISETSAHFYQTTLRNNPEDSQLYTLRSENLKSHRLKIFRNGILKRKHQSEKNPNKES